MINQVPASNAGSQHLNTPEAAEDLTRGAFARVALFFSALRYAGATLASGGFPRKIMRHGIQMAIGDPRIDINARGPARHKPLQEQEEEAK